MEKNYSAGHKNQKGDRQTLKDHLIGTAELAEKFGKDIGYPDLAYFCGLYHDLGKYSEDFQKVLEHIKYRVDHTFAGTYITKDYSEIVMRCISAHHSYLQHITKKDIENSIKGTQFKPLNNGKNSCSTKNKKEIDKAISLFNSEVTSKEFNCIEPKFGDDRFAKQLFTRMLLSCLVDADYSDSCEWENKGSFEESESKPLKTDELIKKLDEQIEKVRKTSKANNKINKIRDYVLANCIESAKEERGIFTLTSPTGSGKTLAMLAFALRHAKRHNLRRIIIVLPFLSIIEQNAEIYRKICPNLLEIHSQAKSNNKEENKDDDENKIIKIFTDRYTAPIIVTTSVNFFESFFKCRPVDIRRLHNMTNSVILFDEAQTLPLNIIDETLQTMNLLCENYGCSVVFSTATQPAFEKFKNVKWQPKEIIKNKDEIFKNSKRCEIQIETKEKIDIKEIAGRIIEEKNCCVIVNTKSTAAELYKYLREEIDEKSLFYISSNLCPAHRSDVIQEIKERQKSKEKCIVVSTQCIEAGVDISFDIMYRELAPLPAIIQSAGRVNRNGNNENNGILIIFETKNTKYPDDDYKKQSINAKNTLMNYKNKFDLQNTEIINKYYELLAKQQQIDSKDLKELKDAIKKSNYKEIEEKYKLINKENMIKIIVPYKKQIELYNKKREEIINNGLTKELIKDVIPITLNIYRKSTIVEELYQINYCIYNKKQEQKSDWYLLGSNKENAYNDKLGLDFDDFEENIIF